MITLVLLLKRKRGMTKDQFRDHYETSHVTLAKKFVGHLFLDYRRHYVQETRSLIDEGANWTGTGDGEYDAVTHIVFRDQSTLAEFARICNLPDVKATLTADEERFLDRRAMRVCVCEAVKTWTAADLERS